jgi:DNA polymerase III subunit beta
MKFKIGGKVLVNELKKIITIIPEKTTIPVLKDFLFTLKGNKLVIECTNINLSGRVDLEVSGIKDGKIATDAKSLFSIIEQINEEVNFELKNNKLKVSTNSGIKYNFVVDNIDDYPQMEKGQIIDNFEISSDLLKRLFVKSQGFFSIDQLRPVLTGIFFQPRSKGIRLVACDSLKIIVITFFDKFTDNKFNLLVPGKSSQIIINAMNNYKDEMINIKITDKDKVLFEIDNLKVWTVLLDYEYPNYQVIISSVDPKNKLIVEVDELMNAISRLKVLNDNNFNYIKFNISNDGLKLSIRNSFTNNQGEEIISGINYEGEPEVIGFNIFDLIETLKKIESSKVIFKFKDSVSIVLISPERQNDKEELNIYLSPLRILDDEDE